MQERIKSARPDAIAVMRKLFHHRQAEDGLLAGMHKHMHANEAVIEFPRVVRHRIQYTAA
jgi:hypothetical protein